MFDTNQRKFPRADYPCSLILWREDGNQEVVMARTANIGAGGLAVHLTHKIHPSSMLDISIEFPKNSTPLKCKGKVLRCDELRDGEQKVFYAVAVAFEPMSELKEAYLQGVVSELISLQERPQK